MSEQRIQIDVSTDTAELSDLIAKFNAGNITIGETTKLKKLLNAEAQKTVNILKLEQKEAADYTKALWLVNDAQSKLRLATGAGHEAYFKAGEVLRAKTLPAMTSFSQIIQDSSQFSMGLAQGVRAIGNNIEFATQQITHMISQGHSFKEIMSGIGANIMGTGGILMGVSVLTTAVTLLSEGFRDTGKGSKAAEKAIEDLNKKLAEQKGLLEDINNLRYEAGDLSKQKYLSILLTELETLKLQRDTLFDIAKIRKEDPAFNPANFKPTLNTPGFSTAPAVSTGVQPSVSKESLVENRNKMLELDKKILELEKRVKDLESKKDPMTVGQWRESTGNEFDRQFMGNLPRAGGGSRAHYDSVADIMRPNVQTAREYLDLWDKTEKEKLARRERVLEQAAKDEAALGIGVIQSIVSTIDGEFKNAWVSAFGEANSLFEKLASNITTYLASAALKQGIFSLMSALLPGSSFLGFLAPALGMIGGGNTDSIISGHSSASRMRPIIAPINIGGNEIGTLVIDAFGRSAYRRKM